MTHDDKIRYLYEDLGNRGIRKWRIMPPAFWILWRLGFAVKPPQFLSSWTLSLVFGVPFTILYGTLVFITIWRPGYVCMGSAILLTLLVGSLSGAIAAAIYRNRARKLRLPRWEDYPTETSP